MTEQQTSVGTGQALLSLQIAAPLAPEQHDNSETLGRRNFQRMLRSFGIRLHSLRQQAG